VGSWTKCNIVVNGHREGNWLLENHPDSTAQGLDRHGAITDVLTTELDFARHFGTVNAVIHAV
jgi:hypothetical protein